MSANLWRRRRKKYHPCLLCVVLIEDGSYFPEVGRHVAIMALYISATWYLLAVWERHFDTSFTRKLMALHEYQWYVSLPIILFHLPSVFPPCSSCPHFMCDTGFSNKWNSIRFYFLRPASSPYLLWVFRYFKWSVLWMFYGGDETQPVNHNVTVYCLSVSLFFSIFFPTGSLKRLLKSCKFPLKKKGIWTSRLLLTFIRSRPKQHLIIHP